MNQLHINRLYNYFIQFSTVVLQRGRNKVVQYFVKPFIVISFLAHPVTMRFGDDFRFRTTTELSF